MQWLPAVLLSLAICQAASLSISLLKGSRELFLMREKVLVDPAAAKRVMCHQDKPAPSLCHLTFAVRSSGVWTDPCEHGPLWTFMERYYRIGLRCRIFGKTEIQYWLEVFR